jgi:hypothetical protein
MMALVARGAPRDFVDIKELVDAGLVSTPRCWELWAAKKPGIELDDARVRVQTLRRWYRDEFTAPPAVGRGERRHDSEEPPQ